MTQETGDRERLIRFLSDVRSLLADVVGSEQLFDQDVYPEIRELWTEAEELRLIENVQDVLAGYVVDLDEPPFLDERLERVGLTGRMLDVKLRIFDRVRERVFRNWIPKRIRKLLEIIDTILGSLAAAIPIAEPLVEVKDLIEKLIDGDED